jgi:hypothetical protein
MPSILVICPDRQRLTFLQQVVRQFNPRDSGKVVGAASVGAAQKKAPGLVNAVLLSLVGGDQPTRDLPELQQSFPTAPVLVELDCDDPEQAFAMLRLGAYSVVVSKPITRAEKLADLLSQAVSGQRPYRKPLLSVNRPQPNWGFMSMHYRLATQDQHDYDLAITPAMRYLGLGLQRYDEMDHDGPPDLAARVSKAIDARPVLVAQISTFTHNTAIEIALARERRKTILFLRRDAGEVEPIPALLEGIEYVSYSTMTELAQRLFFGCGGSRKDLELPCTGTPCPANAS